MGVRDGGAYMLGWRGGCVGERRGWDAAGGRTRCDGGLDRWAYSAG